MPHDWPELPDLLITVREFLQQLGPRLDGQDRYHALCCEYLLEIATREIQQWAPLEGIDEARLAALVDGGAAQPTSEVVATLCRNIRAGEFDDRMDELFAALLDHVRHKVEVSRPEHLDQPETQTPTAGAADDQA